MSSPPSQPPPLKGGGVHSPSPLRGEGRGGGATASDPLAGSVGWEMFDWANQPYFTVITTFIFAPYFASVMIGDPVRGQTLWAWTQAIAGITIAVLSPFLGAMADAAGRRKPWIAAFQAIMVVGCCLLWWGLPGRPDLVPLVALGIVLASIGAEFSIVFNNALLPSLVPPERVGRLSGFGWGMGYIGGLMALFAALIVSRPELIGIVPPDGQALFGLDRAAYEAERLTGPASALWLLVFVLPMFLFTPDGRSRGLSAVEAARQGVRRLFGTLRDLRGHRNQALFQLAFMIYNDGLLAVIAFGGIYAAGAFGWSTTELGLFGIITIVFATIGCFAGGWLDDRIGSKRTVRLAIAGLFVATLGIVSVTAERVLFVVPVAPPGGGLFASAAEQVFLVFAVLLGICMGPMQAASRTLVARLAPPGMAGEFYGLFALSGRATAFLAPVSIGIVTALFASQRAGLVVVLVFLGVGFALLALVREPARG